MFPNSIEIKKNVISFVEKKNENDFLFLFVSFFPLFVALFERNTYKLFVQIMTPASG